MNELEPEAEDLLKSGKKLCDQMSDIPPLYSIAISLKRIADALIFVPHMNTDELEEFNVEKAVEWAKQNSAITKIIKGK